MEKSLIHPWPIVVAVLISSTIAIRAYKKKSLDFSGAFSGFIVMTIHFAAGFRYGAMLIVFFFTSSALTKFGAEKKRSIDPEYKDGGQRNWLQVLSNSVIATVLVVIIWYLTGWEDKCLDTKEQSVLVTALVGGVIGHYCCCNGDTWSSEIGILSDEEPRLITNLKHVRRGTNGAVTKTGLIAAAAAGSVIGITFVVLGFFAAKCPSGVTALKQLLLVPVSAVAGLCGSLIDSVLGATLQFSGFCTVRNKVVGKRSPTVRKISGRCDDGSKKFLTSQLLCLALLDSLIALLEMGFIVRFAKDAGGSASKCLGKSCSLSLNSGARGRAINDAYLGCRSYHCRHRIAIVVVGAVFHIRTTSCRHSSPSSFRTSSTRETQPSPIPE
ncbi:hypothetical protein Nepgr_022370 [Nepenthes gracilis]|uniref:Transmembrane protein 19 n=1 Tax=Nepenthes gracilis TaxID=150966 RepID=A0AAD3T0L7_NEPGR|nr:hypothetical protein Nepgr_022370 [Nepenthes gracilis]